MRLSLILLGLSTTALSQFSQGFAPLNAPYGGFGGCANRTGQTAIVFLHGNGGKAGDWTRPSSTAANTSPITHFTNAGYPCLFGLSWLSTTEQGAVYGNNHNPTKAQMVGDFVRDVSTYMGGGKVVVIGHSMGVTVGLHALDYTNRWALVQKFISIVGAMQGLKQNCAGVGYNSYIYTTCASQSATNTNIFGFWPGDGNLVAAAANPRMSSTAANAFVKHASLQPTVTFYSINDGISDQFICPDHSVSTCVGMNFIAGTNVPAAIDIGVGTPATNAAGTDDTTGVGHFRAKSDSGAIQVNMVAGCASVAGCCVGYSGTKCVQAV